MINYKR